MAQTVSDLMIQRLHAWGVPITYGYPGDGITGLMAAIERSEGEIRFVQASSLFQGAPDRWRVVKQSAKQMWASIKA